MMDFDCGYESIQFIMLTLQKIDTQQRACKNRASKKINYIIGRPN